MESDDDRSVETATVEEVTPRSPPDENVPEGAMATAVGDARVLSEALDATGMAINYYELDPGESFAHSAHRHETQEEVFYVLSGTATFEILGSSPDTEPETLTIEAGQLIRVPPGTFQFGVNRGDDPVEALALGAPREYQGTNEYLIDCGDCRERTVQVFERHDDRGEAVCRCTDCGAVTHRISY